MYKYKVIFIFITGQNTETESLGQKAKLTHEADQGLKLPLFSLFWLFELLFTSKGAWAREASQGCSPC